LVYGRTKDFELTRLGQNEVKWPRLCLASNVFAKSLFFKRCTWQTPSQACFGSFMIKKKVFTKQSLNLIKKFLYFFIAYGQKSFKLFEHFFKKSKILWHLKKKDIAWILQQVCKIPKDFDLYFENIKKLFLPIRIYYSLLI
jgi:hypothetical protein